ncbi:MAG: glycoside hydrolase family 113 [Flavobacteriaceae bacterium]
MKRTFLILVCLLQFACKSQYSGKIKGVSFVGSRERVTQEQVNAVVDLNADHAAIMPFGFIRNLNTPEIIFNTDRQWFGETTNGAKQYIRELRNSGLKIMLKPQIWIWRGEFTGDLAMKSEEDWKILEHSYQEFILTYVALANELKAEIFCIGTELDEFVQQRPAFWKELIGKIKKQYNGKLTYAANWDEYPRVYFWPLLDYIGIDAYFPLSDEKTPTIAQLKEGWQPWKEKILSMASSLEKPVLFTEFGYRSMDYTAKKPWLVDRADQNINLAGQANAKTALFEVFWNEDWFAGGFVWKWFIHHNEVGGSNDNRFTPQNKPAEEVIKLFYHSY